MIQQSDSIESLAAALAEAQGEVENAHKNAKNPHFRSNYADLAEIINTVRPVFTKHGLAIVQFPGYEDGVVTVDTQITHKSGEWIRSTAGAPAQKMDPQGVGSAVTYLRRYSLAALCGIAQEDDDGEGAVSRNGNQQAQQPARQPTSPSGAAPASAPQLKLVESLMKSSVLTDIERAGIQKRIDNGMSKASASEAIEWLNVTIAERKAEPATAGV